MSNRGQLGHMPYDYKAARGAHDHAGQFFAFPRPSTLSFAMPLDVGADVLEIVQRVCDRALNVATASAKSSTHGPKAGMRALYGKTVQHLPGGEATAAASSVLHLDDNSAHPAPRTLSRGGALRCTSPDTAASGSLSHRAHDLDRLESDATGRRLTSPQPL